MTDSIRKRIEGINKAETPDELKKWVCPFFEVGGNKECIGCPKDEASLNECKDYYLERIRLHPMDIWCEEFDEMIILPREVTPAEKIVGIGTTCNSCYMNTRCPMYKENYTCGIDWKSKKPKTPMEFMDFLIDLQYERVKRSSIFEKVDGGVADLGLSGEMDRLNNYVAQKENLGRDRFSISVEASSAPAAGGGGILAKLFGGGGTTEKTIPEAPKAAIPEATDAEFVIVDSKVKEKQN